MSYKSSVVDRVYMVRWDSPTLADSQAVLKEVQDLSRSQQRPLLCVVIIPETCKPPADEVRQHHRENMESFLASLELLQIVVEGSGFKSSILRSAVTSILFISSKRPKVKVYKAMEEAIEVLRDRIRIPIETLMLAARSKGLLTAPYRPQEQRASP